MTKGAGRGSQGRSGREMSDKKQRATAGDEHKPGQKEVAQLKPAKGKRQRLRGPMDEQWLERNIREMYQEVVKEPIPEDMLKILNQVSKLKKDE